MTFDLNQNFAIPWRIKLDFLDAQWKAIRVGAGLACFPQNAGFDFHLPAPFGSLNALFGGLVERSLEDIEAFIDEIR